MITLLRRTGLLPVDGAWTTSVTVGALIFATPRRRKARPHRTCATPCGSIDKDKLVGQEQHLRVLLPGGQMLRGWQIVLLNIQFLDALQKVQSESNFAL